MHAVVTELENNKVSKEIYLRASLRFQNALQRDQDPHHQSSRPAGFL